MTDTNDVRTQALLTLPPAHACALRLRDAGTSRELIAHCLGIEAQAVGPLLAVAEAKLAEILKAAKSR